MLSKDEIEITVEAITCSVPRNNLRSHQVFNGSWFAQFGENGITGRGWTRQEAEKEATLIKEYYDKCPNTQSSESTKTTVKST